MIIFAFSNEKLQLTTTTCREIREKYYFVFPYDNGFSAAPVSVDVKKPRLDYLECDISHICNLNCKGCANFSSLTTGKKFYELEQYKNDLLQLKKLFWGITKIRLLGGEPLLNPKLSEYADFTRSVFPDCDLRIVTNGLLIPSLDEAILKRLKDAGCAIEISAYKNTNKKRKEIDRKLHDFSIDYFYSIPMRFFFKTILTKPYETGDGRIIKTIRNATHLKSSDPRTERYGDLLFINETKVLSAFS